MALDNSQLKTQMKMHKTDNSDIAIEKYTDHGGQSARALEK